MHEVTKQEFQSLCSPLSGIVEKKCTVSYISVFHSCSIEWITNEVIEEWVKIFRDTMTSGLHKQTDKDFWDTQNFIFGIMTNFAHCNLKKTRKNFSYVCIIFIMLYMCCSFF